ncbi:MAG: hypothetical protein IJI37_00325 [Opitutales bacterium]|nr:hypothetical protein [Opitutales bacterium]
MKRILFFAADFAASAACFADFAEVSFIRADKTSETRIFGLGEGGRLLIPLCDIPANIARVEILHEHGKAKVGDDGYFVMPNGVLTLFKERRDGEFLVKRAHFAMTGAKTPSGTYAAIVKKMPYSFSMRVEKKGENYAHKIVFDFSQRKPYDDILIDYVKLEGADANYSGMARAYREYKLASGAVKPIREKIKFRPALKYCITAPEIRIRQAWKPCPPKVIHQTIENEPKMRIAADFDRVGDIVAELQKQGVDKAELCLVGWNKSGHDGRYPQMFPVEPLLGGEARLRALIKDTLARGYLMTCHTNSTDAYEIADTWDKEYIIKRPDGSLSKNNTPWSGGEMYDVCWRRAYERFGIKDLRKVADLGFKGMHYIDVVSCVPARDCFDPRHDTNPDQASWYMNKIFDFCNDTFGGSMSEGAYDHCFGSVDSVLYVSFLVGKKDPGYMIDRIVPVWQIAYHGIVLSSPGGYTVNYPLKGEEVHLKFVEFGGRPTFYFYSRFRDGGAKNNWMGEQDLTCETDEKLADSVSKIKAAYDEHLKMAHLQLEFMDFHTELADGVFLTRYSDGTEIVTNYTGKKFTYKHSGVEPVSFRVFAPSLAKRVSNLF